MGCEQVFEDAYGAVIDHQNEGFIEIRWYDTTAEMTQNEFKNWLLRFTEVLDHSGSQFVVVDATSFKMEGMAETMDWRDETIIPRYNQNGVKKFAFHLPAGSPPIGNTPVPEGPADFPTGYFATRAEATEWLVT